MSEENVELVRRIFDAYERKDFATLFAYYDAEIEWRIDERVRGPFGDFESVYYGHDGVRAFWRVGGLRLGRRSASTTRSSSTPETP